MAGHFKTQQILHFSNHPQFSGFMKPCRYEGEIQNLEVYGVIPKEIEGTFYRVMPDPQFPPFIDDDPVTNTPFASSRASVAN
jgi:carotenoid cleavage dioxygenase